MTLLENGLKQKENSKPQDTFSPVREWLKCYMSPFYFLKTYVKIQDKATMRTVPYQMWPYLVQVLECFLMRREIIILKARQLGISWLVCCYAVWLATFHPNVRVLITSQGENEAKDMITKCKFIFDNLPDFLRPEMGHTAKGWLEFPSLKSEIKALASTDKAGRSTDATLVIRDELERHDFAKENFLSIGPTVDAGGQLIDLSTIDKTKGDTESHFQGRYRAARRGDSTAFPIFLGWRNRPIRLEGMTLDEWFDEKIRKKYTPYEVEQEYPGTEAEALSPSQVRKFFDDKAVNSQYVSCMESQDTELTRKYAPYLRIYRSPVVARRYVSFCDPSDGKDDPHCTIWLDAITGEEVAMSYGKCTVDMAAVIYDEVNRYYNKAYTSFERNAFAGGTFATIIGGTSAFPGLNTPNQHYQKPNILGWWTGEPQKKTMLWDLEYAMRGGQLIIHSREILDELLQWLAIPGKMPAVPKGRHDDLGMTLAGAWQMKKYQPVGTFQITSTRYR